MNIQNLKKSMESEDVKFFQKHVRIGSIDVHPTEKALVINYELEAALVGQLGDTMLEETKELKKIIRIKNLSEDTDVKTLASDIIEKCTLIPQSKQHEVEQLLYYLQTRKQNFNSAKIDYSEDAKFKDSGNDIVSSSENEEIANISSLDDYIELLYEGIPQKVKASGLVLQLARKPDNLTVLAKNDTLLGALARVLREDGRKSIELSTNIVYAFFCFSTFRQFHSVVAQHKVGSLCMEMVEGELKRYDQWNEEMSKKKDFVEQEKSNISLINEYDKNYQKYISVVKRQDQLLRVCFYLLYNISADPKVEIKMVNRGIVGFLSKCLKRDDPDLLILDISFLKKLSVYIENKIEMIQHNVIENISLLVPHENPDLLSMALRLLWNLSFDIELRNLIVRCGFVPKFISLLSVERYRTVVLGILYHISMEDRYKTLLTYIDCIPTIMNLIIECNEVTLPMHLIAFGINLAGNKRNAQLMCSKDSFSLLIGRAMKYRDPLLMKMIRNMSQHDGTKDEFVEFVDDLCSAIVSVKDNDDFVLECLGTLGNIATPQIDFEKIFVQYNLLDFMKKKFTKDGCEDDFLTEIIIVTGATAVDEACAAMILESGIVKNIIDFLNAKQEDDEIVLSIVYLFYRLIYHPNARETIIKDTHIPAYLTDLMHDKNPLIKKYCGLSLDMITANNEEWAKKIQTEKFRWHNCQWLEMIESQQIEDGDFYVDDSYTPCLQETDILNRSDLLYGSGAYESLLSDGSLSPDILEDLNTSRTSETSSCRPKSRYENRFNVFPVAHNFT